MPITVYSFRWKMKIDTHNPMRNHYKNTKDNDRDT